MPFTKTAPQSIWCVNKRARSMSPVHKEAPKPKGVPLATVIASSTDFTRMMAAAGPKVSSLATVMAGETWSSTVG